MSENENMTQQEMRAHWVRVFCAALPLAHTEAAEHQRPVEVAADAADEALGALISKKDFGWLRESVLG